ncbi:MAG: hypothetical protein ACC655_05800, partial [Rhodothermia bacterium]
MIQGIVARARDVESGIVGASYCPVLSAQVKAISVATRDSEHGEVDGRLPWYQRYSFWSPRLGPTST